MTIKELGELLKEERLRQGRGLDEIMAITKLSRRSLEAIEEGNMDSLPEHVYTKGFILAYAKVLNMPMDDLAKSVDEAYGVNEKELHLLKENSLHGQPEENFKIRSDLNRSPKGGKRIKILLLLIILIIIAVFAWQHLENNNWFKERENSLTGSRTLNETNVGGVLPNQDQDAVPPSHVATPAGQDNDSMPDNNSSQSIAADNSTPVGEGNFSNQTRQRDRNTSGGRRQTRASNRQSDRQDGALPQPRPDYVPMPDNQTSFSPSPYGVESGRPSSQRGQRPAATEPPGGQN